MTSTINLDEIMELIPHRYPFLLLDRVENFVANESATGIKNITYGEHFFQGHFPNNPVMPGVLMIEALAQTAGVLVAKSLNLNSKKASVLFTGIENAKFRRSAVPGDVLKMDVKILKHKLNIWFCSGVISVDNKKVLEAEFSAMITE